MLGPLPDVRVTLAWTSTPAPPGVTVVREFPRGGQFGGIDPTPEPAPPPEQTPPDRPDISPDATQGSPFDIDQMFGAYEDGRVFEYRDFESRDVKEMLRRDGKARTIEHVLTLPLMQAGWSIKPGKGDKGQADFVEEALTRPANAGGMSTPMDLVIGQAVSAALYKKAFFEKSFTIRQGKVVYDSIDHRPVTTCEVARDPKSGAFRGFRQYPYRPAGLLPVDIAHEEVDWVDIAPHRAWVHIHGQHRDPLVGVSEMDIPLWCYKTKQKIRFLWYTFLEAQALPKAFVSHSDVSQARATARDVARLKNSGVLAKSKDVTVEPYESNGRGASEFQAALRWLDGEMAQSVLAGFTGLTEQSTGSYALSKDQSDFFLMSRQAAAKELAAGVSAWVIPDLVRYNYGADAPMPSFEFGALSDVDVSTALTLLSTLTGQQGSPLPAEFIMALAEKAADYLDLDQSKVRDALEHAAERAEERAKAGDIQAEAGAKSAEAAAEHALMEGAGQQADKVAEKKRKEARSRGTGSSGTRASGVSGPGSASAKPKRS